MFNKIKYCINNVSFQIYERARQLLYVADRLVAELSYTLSKHVRWHILLCDLMQYYLNETMGENTSVQDLVKKTKTCITSVRLGQGTPLSYPFRLFNFVLIRI